MANPEPAANKRANPPSTGICSGLSGNDGCDATNSVSRVEKITISKLKMNRYFRFMGFMFYPSDKSNGGV